MEKFRWRVSKWLRADCLDLGGNWQPEDLSGQEVSADHLCGRVCMQTDDREGGRDTRGRWDPPVSTSDRDETHRGAENNGTRLKVTGCVRARRGNTAFIKGEFEWEWETQMGRKSGGESDREMGGKAVGFLRPSFPASSAVLAVWCSGEERLPKPSPRLHVWTQSLPLPC